MGLLNPGVLGLLGLGAIPIVIHLLNRRRFQVVRWAAIEFLLRAQQKTRQRLRLENLLLLLLRTAAVLLVAFAASRPFLPSAAGAAGLEASRTHLYLLVDNSASMGYAEGLGTLLARAVSAAREEIAALRDDDPVTLVVACDEVRRRNGRPSALLRSTRDHDKVRDVLSRLEPSDARLDPSASLSEVAGAAESDGLPRRLVVLSDFQRCDWDPREGGEAAAPAAGGAAASGQGAIAAQVRRLRDALFTIAARPCGTAPPEDAAVLDVGPVSGRPPAEDQAALFEVVLGNHGTGTASVDVSLAVDGRPAGTRRVTLRGRAPGSRSPETARAEFPWTGRAGSHFAEATLSRDRLKVDDRRGHAFTVTQRIRALAVDGDPRPAGGRFPETELLATALSLHRGVTPVELRVVERVDLARETLEGLDVVIVANLDLFPRESAARLASFVRRGGGLLLFPGDKVSPQEWNASLAGPGGAGLLPARLADRPRLIEKDAAPVIDLSASRHPALRDLTDPSHGTSFEPPRVWGFWPVQAPLEPGAEVVLRLKDLGGSPVLLERRVGRGRVLLWTTAVDGDWGGPATELLFAPLLNELVSYAAGGTPARRDLPVHAAVVRTVPDTARDFTVTSPDGQLTRDVDAAPREDPDDPGRPVRTLQFDGTARAGRYVVRWRAPRAGEGLGAPLEETVEDFAVDIDPREGDVARIGLEALQGLYPEMRVVAEGGRDVSGRPGVRPPTEGDLSPLLLGAGVLLLVAEMFLAAAFGRKRG